MPNQLIYETSPYLLQHAENPVDWYPWGEEALTKAITEDKPIIVSIGYSACHWCHVMERESFEKEEVARVMNEHFVCIKVDREERPDVDSIYMEAVQAMGVHGGWPLNVFLMPDAKPFYGVTYLPKTNWLNLLESIHSAYVEHHDDLARSAEGFATELNLTDTDRYGLTQNNPVFAPETLDVFYRKIAVKADDEKGGMRRAPKFPMPSIWRFLLRYYDVSSYTSAGNDAALHLVTLTLDRMALGGIYDQLGGGFARYSTDADWFAPHFEKMLYDNGQLLTLYAEAYSLTKSPLYKHVVYQTIAFAQRELLSPEGGFYSALDADSEGVEGKFYTFTTAELQEILGGEYDWFAELYNLPSPSGRSAVAGGAGGEGHAQANWEHGRNILHRTENDEPFAERMGWTMADLNVRLDATHTRLLRVRNERIRPGLDDKILCSWNGLMLKGLATAYRVFGEPEFLTLALRNAYFLLKKMRDSRNGRLWHTYKTSPDGQGRAKQAGFLDDYAAVIDGLLALYQATFIESWLNEADQLMQYVLANFVDSGESEGGVDPMFFFTDKNGEELIARRKEIFDNVVPSSNSMMAENLYALSLLLERPDYAARADQMLGRIQPLVQQNADYLTNWAAVFAMRTRPTAEIAIVGPDAELFRTQIDAQFYPNKVLCGTVEASEVGRSSLPLLQQRGAVNGQTTVYVCYNRACQLPVTSVEEVWRLLR